ncbi:MAG: polymer-forming cytoskeletal protein [Phycisphaerales bacterium]|nr:polymer-forming cytoskeletal protein [Phycisphaerales bacterium]
MAESNADFGTIIGKDANFKGELSYDGAANILGTIEGSITSKGKLNIASGATCKATIKTGEVTIQGRVEGDIEAAERVDLQASGQLTGDITANRMTMADGASFIGTCRIGAASRDGKFPARPTSDDKLKQPAPEVVVKQPAMAKK